MTVSICPEPKESTWRHEPTSRRYRYSRNSAARAFSHFLTFPLCHFLTFSLVLTIPLAAHAQSAETDTAPGLQEPLAARQQIVRDRLVQLEDRMFRLSEKLRETEPEQARRLEQALRQTGELLIRHRMEQAMAALERSELAEAAEHQAAAEQALQNILTLLTESGSEELDRQRELDRMRDLRAQVDRMLDRQRQLRARTNPGEQLPERLAAAAARVRELIERQEQVQQKGLIVPSEDDGPDNTPDQAPDGESTAALAEAQADIRQDTETAAGDLDRPAGSMDRDPLSRLADRARRDLQDSADAMREAEAELSEGHPRHARPRQAQALESLRKALESLESAAESAQPLESADAARRQRQLEQEAGKLADSMQEAAESPDSQAEAGDPGEAAESGQPGGDSETNPSAQPGEPAEGSQQGTESPSPAGPQEPGGHNVRRAQQHMKQAGDKLEADKPEQATRDQERAIEQLERARAELEEALDQLRREQQEETLAGLEQRFRTMLIQQRSINVDTEDLDVRRDEWTRGDSLNLAGLAEKQNGLADEAGKALNILIEEGTTVVFPEIVDQMRDDMTEVGRRLGERQTGPVTREIQTQIVEALEELIAAVEQRRNEGPPPPSQAGQPGQSGSQEETPLLPGSAELKLLRSGQVRVNRQTQQLAEMADAAASMDSSPAAEDAAEIGNQAQRLADRQEQLADMARRIHERAVGR